MLRLLIGLSALTALGCAGNVTDDSRGSTELPIYGGVESGSEDDFVVRLEAFNDLGLKIDCSGSLVHPRLVLTARHCLFHFNPPPFQCGADGELASDGEGGKFGTAHDPKQVSLFYGPGYPLDVVAHGTEIISGETPSLCRDDLALLVLDQPVAAPSVALRVFHPVETGELVSVIGYGFGTPETKQVRKRVSGLPVESVGPEQVDPADDSLTPPRSFALGRANCTGDSGGPALSDDTGAILGVASLNSQVCDVESVRNFFPRIAPHSALISEAFATVGGEPLVEGDPNPAPEGSSGCAVSETTDELNPLFGVFLLLSLRMRARRFAGARTRAR